MITKDLLKDRNLFIDFLAVLFGMGSWIAVNGTWSELTILVQNLPEGWDISSYISVIIQIANVVPAAYTLSQKLCPGAIKGSVVIHVIMVIGVASCLLLVFFWDKTTYISGVEHSTALFILLLLLSIVDCTSSVVFFPFMGLFRKVYMTSFLIGESFSGLIPGLAALGQGAGATECRVVLETDNVTGISVNKTSQAYVPPNFSINAFFLILCVMMIVSWSAYIMLSYLPLAKREKVTHPSGDSNHDNPPKFQDLSEKTPLITNKNQTSKAFFWALLFIQLWDSTIGNGILTSLQTYSCLPYGADIMHLTVTLGMVTSPCVCIFCLFIKLPKRYGIIIPSIIGTIASIYIIITAAYSPTPPLHDTSVGKFLIVLVWVLKSGTFSFSKVCIANVMRDVGGSALLWFGVSLQIGPFVGSILSFVLVAVLHVFQSAPPC